MLNQTKPKYEMQGVYGYVRLEFEQRVEAGWVRGYSRKLTYDQNNQLVETTPWEHTGVSWTVG